MLSKTKIKYLRSLEQKKQRYLHGLFVAEGNKLVADMLPAFACELLVTKTSWLATQGNISTPELLLADEEDIRRVSFLKNPQDVFAVFRMPEWSVDDVKPNEQLVLALDSIQDPGNLGTIIRLADWFGIEHIVCSSDTADVYNPKVVQATMGALAHVQLHYVDLAAYLAKQLEQQVPIYGTFLDRSEDLYRKELSPHGIIVMGNEGNGISEEIERLVSERLYIPPYPAGRDTSESLNVAVATTVVCAEFRRRCR